MVVSAAPLTAKDFKSEVKPTWCPGCGDFAVLSATYKALADLRLRPEQVVVVSGIGCSSRIPYFCNTYGIHGLHGRALPLATGVKVARPDLTVIVMGGDGDLFSIGAGHFPHAARRNLDVLTVCMDNQVYGLTKAQFSPTSFVGHKTKSSPYGTVEWPMNPVLMALAAGASWVARGYSGRPKQLQQLIMEGITHKGFAFLHVQSPCTEFHNTYTYYDARVQDIPPDHDPSDYMAAIRLAMPQEKTLLGVFYKAERPVYEEQVHALEKVKVEFDPDEFLSRYA